MMKIIVCSNNPIKIQAVKEGFSSYFNEFELKELNLKKHAIMSSQPLTAKQTLEEAIKRVEIAQDIEKGDYYVSLEGGVGKDQFGAFLTWYVCISDKHSKRSLAGGGRMALPLIIYKRLLDGGQNELGEIIDELARDKNTKQKGGATALFTGNRILRKDVFKRDVIIALVPFTSTIFQKLEKM